MLGTIQNGSAGGWSDLLRGSRCGYIIWSRRWPAIIYDVGLMIVTSNNGCFRGVGYHSNSIAMRGWRPRCRNRCR